MTSLHETHLIRRAIVALGLLSIAAVHVLDLPSKWAETRYLGIGYVGVIVISLFLAERVIAKPNRLDYLATAALAASVFVGFVINRTIGMPGAMDDIGNWTEHLGLLSLLVEALVVHQALVLAKVPFTGSHQSGDVKRSVGVN
ncbi:MAG: hypothetical protein RL410_609 [Actinomycetota bacterium]|jgi:hypothetical protein